jgi:hypothetical protein
VIRLLRATAAALGVMTWFVLQDGRSEVVRVWPVTEPFVPVLLVLEALAPAVASVHLARVAQGEDGPAVSGIALAQRACAVVAAVWLAAPLVAGLVPIVTLEGACRVVQASIMGALVDGPLRGPRVPATRARNPRPTARPGSAAGRA